MFNYRFCDFISCMAGGLCAKVCLRQEENIMKLNFSVSSSRTATVVCLDSWLIINRSIYMYIHT